MPVLTLQSHPAPRLSVIIPSRDGFGDGNVERLVAALRTQERIGEAEILLVVGERPNGHARNVGVARSRAPFLVFMDDDARLRGRRVLVELLTPLEAAPADGGGAIGMTGSATALPPDANRFQRLQAARLPRTVFPEVDRLTDTDMAHHLCCALPRSVWEAIGGESDTLETGTDVDLRFRLRRLGLRIVVVPRTVAEHAPPATWRAFWRKHSWYGSGKVQLDRLHPPPGRDVIGIGLGALPWYLLRAFLTFPLRLFRVERAAPWGWNPLLATADLARKCGYARAAWRDARGLPAARGERWSSATLEEWLLPRQPEIVPPPAPSAVRRLLIVATAGLGDAVTALPALLAVRRQFPEAEITAWVSRPGAGEVLRRRGVADRIVQRGLSSPSRVGRLLQRLGTVLWLRRRRFDLALVNFINSTSDIAVLLRLGGVPQRAGYVDDIAAPSLFNLPVHRPPTSEGRGAVDRHLDLLAPLGVPMPSVTVPHWPTEEAAIAAARAELQRRGATPSGALIGVHAGCGANMAWKRWPAENVIELGRRLRARGCGVILFGGPEEGALARALVEAMGPGAIEVTDVVDLDRTAALLRACDLVISNDSGIYNLAMAAGAPVLVLFGPSLPQISRPWRGARQAQLLTAPVPCHPCYDYRRPPAEFHCPVGRACVTGIGVDQVLETAGRMLAHATGVAPWVAVPSSIPVELRAGDAP